MHQFSDFLPPEQVGTWHDVDAETAREHRSLNEFASKGLKIAEKKIRYAKGVVNSVVELHRATRS
jgi:hypothetical protein